MLGDDMLNNVKIAIFDLDGTLLNNNHKITEKTKDALNLLHSHNIKLVLASGRVDSYAAKYAKELNIIDYIIANNGALIYDYQKKEIIYEEYYDISTLNKLWQYANDNEIGITLNAFNERYSNTFATTSKDNNTIIDDISKLGKHIYQVVFTSFDHSKIKKLLTYLNDIDGKISYISKHYYNTHSKKSISVDLNLNDTSKGNSIEYLLNILKINKNDAVCFGDNNNDLSMFNKCGIKVAMGNSNDNVKNISDYITSDNNSDGIYQFINKNMDL